MRALRLLALAGVLGGSCGCGGKGKSAAPAGATASLTATDASLATEAQPELAGFWDSGCVEESADVHYVVILQFSATVMATSLGAYEAAGCPGSTPVVGTYTLRDYRVAGGEGATRLIDYTLRSAQRRYYTPASVANSNAAKVFGYDDWQQEQLRDIAGRSYAPGDKPMYPVIGSPVFGILGVEGEVLTLADLATGDGSTEELRPKALGKVQLRRVSVDPAATGSMVVPERKWHEP